MAKRCYGCMQMKTGEPVCEHCGFDETTPSQSHQLPLGTVLKGQYEIGRVLGQGGFGITYLGWDRALDTAVAIKEYYPNSVVSRESSVDSSVVSSAPESFEHNKKRFLQEARTLARLGNIPGTVRVYNLFEENDTAYFVMEYVQGVNLRRYVQMAGGRLTPGQTLAVLKPILEALEQVHAAELVHRDISPDNIMLKPDGTAKLLDFGAVREVVAASTKKELAQSTEAILKHGFAPMEQYQKRGSLGPWTDVYALCATMFYCMTGKVPPDAPARMMDEIDLGWSQIPGLNERQAQALTQGMALMPKDRTASVTELYQGLYGQLGAPIPPTVPVRPQKPGQSKEPPRKKEPGPEEKPRGRGLRRFLIAAVLALLVIGGGFLGFKLGGGVRQESQTKPEDLVNFLLISQEPDGSDHTSDTMLLLTMNKKTKTVRATSILPDTYVKLPDYMGNTCGSNRIDAAYHLGFTWGGTGGALEMASMCIRDNFGIDVDYRMEIKSKGVENLVDLMGGIQVELTESEALSLGLTQAGPAIMDGEAALRYMRLDMDETVQSHIVRTRRQRTVLEALLNKVNEIGLDNIQDLASQLMPYFYTDMTSEDVVACMWDLVPMLPLKGFETGTCPVDGTYQESTIVIGETQVAVLKYDKEENNQAMAQIAEGLE